MNVSMFYWSNGVLTACFLSNPMPSQILRGRCPLQVLRLEGLLFIPRRVFRCVCFINIPKHQWDKLDPRAVKGIFLDYLTTQKGYKCYVLEKKGKYFVIMDVTFFEDVPYYSLKGNEILEPNRQGEPTTFEQPILVQDVLPPSYPISPSSTPLSPKPFLSESGGFMSCILSLPNWSIGLAMDWALGQGYFGHCTSLS